MLVIPVASISACCSGSLFPRLGKLIRRPRSPNTHQTFEPSFDQDGIVTEVKYSEVEYPPSFRKASLPEEGKATYYVRLWIYRQVIS